MNTLFPVLPYEELRATRDTIQGLVQVIASIRTKLDVPQRHWSHAALQVVATGLTTGPLGLNNGSIMQITPTCRDVQAKLSTRSFSKQFQNWMQDLTSTRWSYRILLVRMTLSKLGNILLSSPR
jgi:Family of unknown function (DUF5996)